MLREYQERRLLLHRANKRQGFVHDLQHGALLASRRETPLILGRVMRRLSSTTIYTSYD